MPDYNIEAGEHLIIWADNEPEDGIIAIGSGGQFALAAARALSLNTNLGAKEIVEKSLKIAASICIYTNSNLNIDEIVKDED